VDDGDEIDEESSALLGPTDDVADRPNDAADSHAAVVRKIPGSILEKYEVYSYRNAALILSENRKAEFEDIIFALESFTLTTDQIRTAGGNESEIPKAFSGLLRPRGWHETVIQGDLKIRLSWTEGIPRLRKSREVVREKFLDGHKIDYVKDRVAFDLEWNSKDQTFDRDLYAMSAFAQCGVIDAAVLVTRSKDLNEVFRQVGPALTRDGQIERNKKGAPRPTIAKYGASTTWMGKLLYRLNAGRNGGCPVLAIGIKAACVTDWRRS
jgi:hypothetical protein